MNERYEVEVVHREGETRETFRDLEEAASVFYKTVADNIGIEHNSVFLHDLVASDTLAAWEFDPDVDLDRVFYDLDLQRSE